MSILFICCDMGETRALVPIMHEMQVQNIDFDIVAMGASIEELKKSDHLKDRIVRIVENIDTVKHRSRPIENVAQIVEGLNPAVVISGPASKAQGQILAALPGKKIVYLDNFNYDTASSAFETAIEIAKIAQELLCVSNVVKDQIQSAAPSLKDRAIKPLGRPSLENWVRQIEAVDRPAALKKVHFQGEKKVVTFIGGYGARYDNFVNAAYASAKMVLENAGYQVHIQHHPNLKIEQPLTTPEAVGLADFIVCYDSTVGFEALFANKQVIYLQPEGMEVYDNIAIQKKLAQRVQTNDQLLAALEPTSITNTDIYETLGVERNSIDAIVQHILRIHHSD